MSQDAESEIAPAMNIETMRRIDRLVGVPLCFLATQLLRLWQRWRPAADGPVRRVLFIELSEMGSTILADPAMRLARDRLGAELHFAIFASNAASLELLDTVPRANVFRIRDDAFAHLVIDTLRFLRWARRRGIDTVIDLEPFSRYTSLLTGLSGAARRVGFYRFSHEGLYCGEMLTHRVAYNPHGHIAQNFVALVTAAGEPADAPHARVGVDDAVLGLDGVAIPPAARAAMLGRVRAVVPTFDPARHRLVLVNPNASDFLPQRRWMPERFAALTRRLLAAERDVVVLITGAPAEQAGAAALAAQVDDPRCRSIAGRLAVAELPALYALATLMVTNDSGPAHFAAVVALPTVVLFGPETPRLYRPLGPGRAIYAGLACSPCVSAYNHRRTACTDNVCMKAITVDTVFAAVAELLADRTAARRYAAALG